MMERRGGRENTWGGREREGVLHPACFGPGNLTEWCGNEDTTDTEEMADTYRKAEIGWDVPLTLMEGAYSHRRNTTHLLRVHKEEGLVSSEGGLCRGVV